MKVVYICLFFLLLSQTSCRRGIPEYVIDLDLPVDQRLEKVVDDFSEDAQAAYNKIIGEMGVLKSVVLDIVKLRGPEVPEMEEEIEYWSNRTGIPKEGVQLMQWNYELSTIMIPVENFTSLSQIFGQKIIDMLGYKDQEVDVEDLQKLKSLSQAMCTGIIALDSDDQTVYHARNLDFSPAEELSKILYIAIFKKGGKEIFRTQTNAGFSGVVTGFMNGSYAVEVNTRLASNIGDNEKLFQNLVFGKRELNCWLLRKNMEKFDKYVDFIEEASKMPLVSNMYIIVSAVGQGTILARAPDSLEHQLVLGKDDPRYIIITNYDFWDHDLRELLDPRRIHAEQILNNSKVLTPEILFDAINNEHVADSSTIYQAIMNVQTGLFNSSTQYDL